MNRRKIYKHGSKLPYGVHGGCYSYEDGPTVPWAEYTCPKCKHKRLRIRQEVTYCESCRVRMEMTTLEIE